MIADQNRKRIRFLLSSLTPEAVICALRLVELVETRDQATTMVRAWLMEEVERRWPEAEAAAGIAFDEDELTMQAGIETPGVDYVGVLLAHVPAEVLAAAPTELPGMLLPLFDGLGIPIVGRPVVRACCASTADVGHAFTCRTMLAGAGVTLPDDALPDADERALQRGLGPLAPTRKGTRP